MSLTFRAFEPRFRALLELDTSLIWSKTGRYLFVNIDIIETFASCRQTTKAASQKHSRPKLFHCSLLCTNFYENFLRGDETLFRYRSSCPKGNFRPWHGGKNSQLTRIIFMRVYFKFCPPTVCAWI